MDELDKFHPKFITFTATSDFSAFPRDTGTNTPAYEIIAWHNERMSRGEVHEFNPHVMVYIPDGFVGLIEINNTKSETSDIDIDERCLGGGKWHHLRFVVKYTSQISSKIDGEWGLAKLTVNKCE